MASASAEHRLTGVAAIMPDRFEEQRLAILSHPWVIAEGRLENVDQVIHVMANRVMPMANPLEVSTRSHDSH